MCVYLYIFFFFSFYILTFICERRHSLTHRIYKVPGNQKLKFTIVAETKASYSFLLSADLN